MTVELDRSSCGWTVPPGEPCGDPSMGVVTLQLPAELVPGVTIAEDQRTVRMGICGVHNELASDHKLLAVSAPEAVTFERYGPLADVIPPAHARHRTPVHGCIGCDIDHGPAHTRVPHG